MSPSMDAGRAMEVDVLTSSPVSDARVRSPPSDASATTLEEGRLSRRGGGGGRGGAAAIASTAPA